MHERFNIPEGLPVLHSDQLRGTLTLMDDIKALAGEHGVYQPLSAAEGLPINMTNFPGLRDETGEIYRCARYFSPETGDYLGFSVELWQKRPPMPVEKIGFFKQPLDVWSVDAKTQTMKSICFTEPETTPQRSEELLDKYLELLRREIGLPPNKTF